MRNYYWLLEMHRLYLLQHWNCYITDLPSCSRDCSLFTTVVRHGDTAGGSWGPNPLLWAGSRAACGKITYNIKWCTSLPELLWNFNSVYIYIYIYIYTHIYTYTHTHTHTIQKRGCESHNTWGRAAYCRPLL